MSGQSPTFRETIEVPGHGLPPELVREAALDQDKRLTRGAYVLSIILIAIWGTTPYVRDHPRFFGYSAAAMLVAAGVRIIMALMRERIYAARPRLLAWVGIWTVAIRNYRSAPCYLCNVVVFPAHI